MLIWMKWIDREARRIRVKSIILLGHRKREWQWKEWLRWEGLKSFIPALVIIPIHLFALTLPNLLLALIVASCFVRVVFVLAHASVVALRLNKRREAFLNAAGYDLTISSIWSDKNAWKVGLSGGTLHDFLKTRRSKG